MTDNVSSVASLGSAIDWIDILGVVIALFALVISIRAHTLARMSFRMETFSSFLKELSSEEARRDRRLVYHIDDTKTEHIKRLIELVRQDDKGNDAELGKAVERTIASLDRVGFFLIGNDRKLAMEPPIWLWTMVSDLWGKVGGWVKYRETCEEDKDFYNKGYGYYFKKLEEYGVKRIE